MSAQVDVGVGTVACTAAAGAGVAVVEAVGTIGAVGSKVVLKQTVPWMMLKQAVPQAVHKQGYRERCIKCGTIFSKGATTRGVGAGSSTIVKCIIVAAMKRFAVAQRADFLVPLNGIPYHHLSANHFDFGHWKYLKTHTRTWLIENSRRRQNRVA